MSFCLGYLSHWNLFLLIVPLKARNVEQINRKLQVELVSMELQRASQVVEIILLTENLEANVSLFVMKEAMDQDPYGLVDNGGDYNSVMGF
jgi:hypothetical protein